MRLKKLTSIITSTLMFLSMFGNNFASAATNRNVNNTTESILKQSDSNVLKVNIDDNGALTYAEPKVTNDENSPFSWDNATVYFVLTDRFENGDTSNDHSYNRSLNEDGSVQSGYKENPGTFHGGDLKGLTKKLNEGYFTDLGVNAIWITAPYEQIHGFTFGNTNNEQEGYGFPYYGYHGYWALDFSNMDANMGTAKDMEEFVDTAHSKGIRVVMDVVMNHLGYITAYDTNEYGFGKTISNWKDYYYGNLSNLRGGDWEEANMYQNDPSWASKWYGGDFVRIAYPFDGYTGSKSGDDQTRCLYGLPDIKMESKTEISTPPFLVNKWKKEGRYDEEMQKQNAFFEKSKLPKTPQNYVVQWLTDWVREYGIDGFRCDTAKHIPVSSWKELKTQADVALKEWRKNNPNKPGANWDENFWMTGEDWGHGVGRDHYFDNGFDSIINFTFPKSGYSPSSLEGIFSNYASKINSDPTFNVLSYISSHDDCLGGRDNLIGAASALLLTPGGAQIFYGDETARGKQWESLCANNYKDQVFRSDMNWNSIDKNVLSHWQKLGQFRNKHLSIGAGQHKMISSSPYTFSRSYQGEDGVVDNVICVVGATGSTTVDVSSMFSDGDTITDYYTGNKATVSDGKVTFTAGTNGVILLESNSKKPAVNASPASGDYYKKVSEGLEIKLVVGNADKGEYSINGGEKISYKNGDKITIGKGEEFGSTTTVELFASNDEGDVTKKFTYTKKNPDDKFIQVHFKKSGWDSPNIYMYQGDGATATQLTGKWPGVAMEKEAAPNSEWYTYRIQGETDAKVIFNINGGSVQEPGQDQPGYDASFEMWYVGGALTSQCPSDYTRGGDDEELEVSLSGNRTSPVDEGETIKLTAKAKNGTSPYAYTFKANGKTLDSDGNTCSWNPSKGNYKVEVTVTDADGNKATSNTIEYDIRNVNNFKIDKFTVNPSTVKVGQTVTLSASTINENGSVQYKFVAKKNNKETVIKDYSTSKTEKWTPSVAGEYELLVYAKDSEGNSDSATTSCTVEESSEEVVITTDKASPQVTGTAIKITAKANGMVGALKYMYSVRTAEDGWKTIKGYSSDNTCIWTPNKSGKYKIEVSVIDAVGNEVSSMIDYNIAAKITRIEENNSNIKYAGTWTTSNNKNHSGGAVKVGKAAGSSAEFKFTGTGIKLLASTYKDRGIAKVTLDGESYSVDMYSAGAKYKNVVFQKNNLKAGTHSIKIEYTGMRNSKAAGNLIIIDAFDITEGNIVEPQATRIEEDDNNIKYEGTWTTSKNANHSGGAVKVGKATGNSAEFKFTGTGIKLLASTYKDRGIAKVTLDGESYSVDMYSAKAIYKNIVFQKKDLKEGTHSIKIEYTGMRNSKATGSLIIIDAFDILGGNIIKTQETRVEESDNNIKYEGTWTTSNNKNHSGGAVKVGKAAGSSAEFKFTGTGIKLLASTYKDRGIAKVTVDGVSYSVDMYSASAKYKNVVFQKKDLKSGTHSVKIEYTGKKNSKATGTLTVIDAVDITSGNII